MKILRLLKRLLPQRGAKNIPAAEMENRLKEMKEKIALSKKREKTNGGLS